MECPQCGGATYDNREKNTERVAQGKKPMPEFKCKDENCGWKKWPPREGGKGGKPQPKAAPSFTWTTLAGTYQKCRKIAVAVLPDTKNEDVIVAATATLFIQAARDGLTAEWEK